MADLTKEYADVIMAAKKAWEESPSELKAQWLAGIPKRVVGFLLLWDTLKEIEKKFNNVDVWNIARKITYNAAFAHGQKLAKKNGKFGRQGLKEVYAAFFSKYEGVCDFEYLEFDDTVLSIWAHACPFTQVLKDMGRTDEEIKEMAPLFNLWEYGVLCGFNPEFETFPQPRLKMKGDSYTTYYIEDHGERKEL